MRRFLATTAVLAALFAVTPASAGTYCLPDFGFCQPVPFVHGEAGLVYVIFDDDAPGGIALFKTGFDVINFTGNDFRGQYCVNGDCSGIFGYTLITGSPTKCGDTGNCLLVYVDGQCSMIARHHGYAPTNCHNGH